MLSRYLEKDEDNSPQERASIAAHLIDCPMCQEIFEADVEILAFIRNNWKHVGSAVELHPTECRQSQIVPIGVTHRTPVIPTNHSFQPGFGRAIRWLSIALAASFALAVALQWNHLSHNGYLDSLTRSNGIYGPHNGDISASLPERRTRADGLDRLDMQMAASIPLLSRKITNINYSDWLEGHRDWFKQRYPWIFKTQKIIEARGMRIDYLDLLMISGDIWQFHFNPRGAFEQKMTMYHRTALTRVARYYNTDADSLVTAIESSEKNLIDTQSDLVTSLSISFEQWQSVLGDRKAASTKDGTELLLLSLRGANYLATTRAAACIWSRAHPSETLKLLGDRNYAAVASFGVDPTSDTLLERWYSTLERQMGDAQLMYETAESVLVGPAPLDCTTRESSSQWHSLNASLEDLRSAVSESPSVPSRKYAQ